MYTKNKYKNTVIAILLGCILTMAVGYSLLQKRLDISGTSSVTSIYDVRFTNIKSTPSNDNVTDAFVPRYTNTTASFSTNLVSPGDYMTYEITVSNLGTLDAIVNLINISDAESDAIEFTYYGIKNGDILKAKESKIITVIVKYKHTVTSQPDYVNLESSFKVNFKQFDMSSLNEVVSNGSHLAKVNEDDTTWLNGPLMKSEIEEITLHDSSLVPSEVGDNYWDASAIQDDSVMAWYYDTDNNGLYEVNIGQYNGVKANPDSSYLFSDIIIKNDKGLDLSLLDTSEVIYMNNMFTGMKTKTLNLSSFNTSNVIDMSYMFEKISGIMILDVSNFNTSKVQNMSHMFSEAKSLTSLFVDNFDTSNVIYMNNMFYYAYNLKELDVSSFNTSKVTDMSNMFRNLYGLNSLNLSNFNTSNVTDMSYMFANTSKIASLDLGSFKTHNVKYMNSMFQGMTNLKTLNVSSFSTGNVTDMSSMFASLTNLENIDVSKFNTSNVTSMANMFYNNSKLTKLNVSSFDTKKVTNTQNMFRNMSSLKSLYVNNFDVSNMTNISYMFDGLSIIKELDLSNWDTKTVKNVSGLFSNCTALEKIYVSDLWNMSAVTNSNYMFRESISLPNFDSNHTDKTMANYTTGYLTYKEASI